MLKRVWRALAVAAMGVVIAGASHVSDLATMGATSILDQPLPETPLQLPGVEPGTKVVAAALADIDADGDLDLVASDGTLDLLVWSNDGSGHFTRLYPAHTGSAGSLSRDGALDPESGTLPASIVPGGSASVVVADVASTTIDARNWRLASHASSFHSRRLLTRASRAPPLTLRSA
jgi:hypothetical protein